MNTFLPWYFLRQPRRIVQRWWEYTWTFGHIFAFWFLFKTILSPWKSITDAYPDYGFNLQRIFEAFTMNCISRCVGFVIRLCTIVAGIAIEIGILLFYTFYFLLWITFPVLALFGLQYLIVSLF